ncbi:hypothetical protein BESEP4_00185 [Staphylococcus phage vB_SepM_BE04]|nr:hypothetical protein BESEP4_00185 [Staphylococcus phage vB_SepM_BE04]
MNFIKRLFKNLWEYLLLPLILVLLVLIILAITIGVISFIAILPSLLLNHFNIQSYFLTIPAMVWFFSVFGIPIVFLGYFNEEEKVKWYKLLLYDVLCGCAVSILSLCIIHPILFLYIILTIIVIAVIVIIIKTIKE